MVTLVILLFKQIPRKKSTRELAQNLEIEQDVLLSLSVLSMDSLQVPKDSGPCLLISSVPLGSLSPTRYDRDVWIRMRDSKDGFDYIYTHIDEFKVVAKDTGLWIDRIVGNFPG